MDRKLEITDSAPVACPLFCHPPPPPPSLPLTSQAGDFSPHLLVHGRGRQLLAWLLHPVKLSHFLGALYERRPLLVRRGAHGRGRYFGGLFSSEELLGLVQRESLLYGLNLDVVRFEVRLAVWGCRWCSCCVGSN